MNRKLLIVLLNVFLPILLGACIYLLFRTQTLIVFRWIGYVGGNHALSFLRLQMQGMSDYIPSWIMYSLPDGLWVYSFTFSMCLLWHDNHSWYKFLFLAFAPTIGTVGELVQYIHLIPGTFDFVDVVICLIGSALPFYIINHYWGKQHHEAEI